MPSFTRVLEIGVQGLLRAQRVVYRLTPLPSPTFNFELKVIWTHCLWNRSYDAEIRWVNWKGPCPVPSLLLGRASRPASLTVGVSYWIFLIRSQAQMCSTDTVLPCGSSFLTRGCKVAPQQLQCICFCFTSLYITTLCCKDLRWFMPSDPHWYLSCPGCSAQRAMVSWYRFTAAASVGLCAFVFCFYF